MQGPEVLGALPAPGRGEFLVLEYGPHEPGGDLEVRLGPDAARRVRFAPGRDGGRGPRDQEAVRLCHELQVAAVGRGDDGLAERHRLGHGQPEPLGAVQRDVTVAQRHESVAVLGVHVLLEQDDVGRSCDAQTQPFRLARASLGVDRLDDQEGTLARGESHFEGVDEPPRVLALHGAEIVEREKKDRALGQTQIGAGTARNGARLGQRWRDGADGHGRVGFDGPPDKVGGHPDLVDVAEALVLGGGEVLDLPVPHTDSVAAFEQRRHEGSDGRRHVRVDAQERRVVWRALGGRHVGGALSALQMPVDRRRRVRDADRGQRVEHEPRGFADAQLPAQVADHVHACPPRDVCRARCRCWCRCGASTVHRVDRVHRVQGVQGVQGEIDQIRGVGGFVPSVSVSPPEEGVDVLAGHARVAGSKVRPGQIDGRKVAPQPEVAAVRRRLHEPGGQLFRAVRVEGVGKRVDRT